MSASYTADFLQSTVQWYCFTLTIIAVFAFFKPAPKPAKQTAKANRVLAAVMIAAFAALVILQISATWRSAKDLGWFIGFLSAMFSEPLVLRLLRSCGRSA